ncbi:unnamed protein product [Protopolystoma xenopodis]|uniref:Uncharacterized protein n=1 Tax=Protopolystoma xenopodis TaxID=117903 RepID=A0A3S5AFN4_9PLAT|nr:unnamed protein product [Protopolystoma xenopodis]
MEFVRLCPGMVDMRSAIDQARQSLIDCFRSANCPIIPLTVPGGDLNSATPPRSFDPFFTEGQLDLFVRLYLNFSLFS